MFVFLFLFFLFFLGGVICRGDIGLNDFGCYIYLGLWYEVLWE